MIFQIHSAWDVMTLHCFEGRSGTLVLAFRCPLGLRDNSCHSWRGLRRSITAVPHSPIPIVTNVPGSGIAVLVAKVQLAEIEAPFFVNDMAAWAGDAVRPTSNGPGVYVPVKSSPR